MQNFKAAGRLFFYKRQINTLLLALPQWTRRSKIKCLGQRGMQ